MAVIFKDGFDWYLSGDILKRWSSYGSSYASIQTADARSPSTQCLLLTRINVAPLSKQFGVAYTQGVIGMAYREQTGFNRLIFSVCDSGTTEQISVRTNLSGQLTVQRGTTVLATGMTVLSLNVWYYIELKFTIHNSTGVIELKLNGVSEIASTGSLDTQSTANTQWSSLVLGSQNAAGSALYDDLYVIDPTTGTNTDFLGPVSILAQYPAAPGNYAQWTSNGGINMGSVSDVYQDGDDSFNQSSTPGQIDSFVPAALRAGAGDLYAVELFLVARQDTGAARTIAPLWRIGGTDYAGTAQALSSDYQFLGQIYDVSPDTSAAWSIAEFNGAEIGYKEVT